MPGNNLLGGCQQAIDAGDVVPWSNIEVNWSAEWETTPTTDPPPAEPITRISSGDWTWNYSRILYVPGMTQSSIAANQFYIYLINGCCGDVWQLVIGGTAFDRSPNYTQEVNAFGQECERVVGPHPGSDISANNPFNFFIVQGQISSGQIIQWNVSSPNVSLWCFCSPTAGLVTVPAAGVPSLTFSGLPTAGFTGGSQTVSGPVTGNTNQCNFQVNPLEGEATISVTVT